MASMLAVFLRVQHCANNSLITDRSHRNPRHFVSKIMYFFINFGDKALVRQFLIVPDTLKAVEDAEAVDVWSSLIPHIIKITLKIISQ